MTRIINQLNQKELNNIRNVIKREGLIIFPTETVYGLGANALNNEAVAKIFIAKGRKNDNPLIVHVDSIKMIKSITKDISPIEDKLIDNFMPGPFTLILPKNSNIPNNVTCGLETVGVRMPSNIIARNIIKYSGVPIAAPSANISTRPSGTRIEDIIDEFDNKVDLIIDGGETDIGLESTVVKVVDNIPIILRPGYITKEDIIKVIGVCELSKNINNLIDKIPESPGMKYKHYAPNKKCILIYNDSEQKQIELVNKNISDGCIVIGFNEHKEHIKTNKFINFGSINDLEELSHNMFKILRSVDNIEGDLVIIEGVKKEGLGLAIMNRLLKASNYNYIEK